MRPISLTIVIFCCCSVLVGCVGKIQRQVIFPAERVLDRDPSLAGWAFDTVRETVGEHETYGWFVPEGHPRGVILFSHGNGGNLSDRLGTIAFMKELGYSVLAYDYGGYGESTGNSSEERCYADIRAMWHYLVEKRGIAPEDIVLWGRSLGGGPTTDLAREVTCRAVILENAFLSTADVARESKVLRPLRGLIRHRFDNKSKIAEITSPLLVIHSPEDEVIPYAHGLELYQRATPPKTFLQIRGGHNTGPAASGAAYRKGIEAFLRGTSGTDPRS